MKCLVQCRVVETIIHIIMFGMSLPVGIIEGPIVPKRASELAVDVDLE
jgi:hypothetical protein